MNTHARLLGLALGAPMVLLGGTPVAAQTNEEIHAEIEALRKEVQEQRALLQQQQARIDAQERAIASINAGDFSESALAALRGAGMQGQPSGAAPAESGMPRSTALAVNQVNPSVTEATPPGPVGEAPPEEDVRDRPAVQAVPQEQGVLTPRGTLVFDPSIEYVGATTNRLVFRGIELIPGIQIGAIEASDVDRDTIVATAAVRYGITSRLEAEIRVPYMYRRDRIEVVQQRDESIVRVVNLNETGPGDVEFGLRYQLNTPRPLQPIWILSARLKSNSGKSPYAIPFDDFGVATGLATGSGFWGFQPGVSFLLPSDPVVIYGGLSYLWNIKGEVNRYIGSVFVGNVDPGDAISANVGFGFAVNPRFSFSLGYRHTYILPTKTQLGEDGGTIQKSNRSNAGSLSMGFSYRITENQTMNIGFNYGVTADSPDVSVAVRVPFSTSLTGKK